MLGRAVAFPSPVLLSPRARVKYCSFPPGGGRLGWGGRSRDGRCKPRLASPLPSPLAALRGRFFIRH